MCVCCVCVCIHVTILIKGKGAINLREYVEILAKDYVAKAGDKGGGERDNYISFKNISLDIRLQNNQQGASQTILILLGQPH